MNPTYGFHFLKWDNTMDFSIWPDLSHNSYLSLLTTEAEQSSVELTSQLDEASKSIKLHGN